MMKKNLIKWGMIGCGKVTELKSAPAYKLVKEFELTSVVARDIEKVKDYAKRHQIKRCFESVDDLINDKDIDAVYIATPPDSHYYYAKKVAAAGKICCIEKPLASSYHESKAINELFIKANKPLFVAYYRRSLPRFNKIKAWIDDGEIGEVRHVSWMLNRKPSEIDMSGKYNWRTDPNVAPGGYFDDLACHGLDLFAFLLGNFRNVSGFHTNQQAYYAVSDAFTASWIHENGVTGSGVWNFAGDHYEDKVEIYGSEGKLIFSVFQEEAIALIKADKQNSVFVENPKNIQLYHVENMAKYIIGEIKTHPSTGDTALHTSWIMDKILGKI